MFGPTSIFYVLSFHHKLCLSYLYLGSAELYISSYPCMPVLSILLAGDLVTLRHLQGNSLQERRIAYFTAEFRKSHSWLFQLHMLAA